MRRPIPSPPISSNEFALLLEPRFSRSLALAWLALHAVLGAALWAAAVPGWAKAAGLVALVLHAAAARPGPAPALVWRADGAFELEADAYRLDGTTTYTDSWVSLRLTGPAGRREVVLVRDQLDRVTWSRLQARLRRNSG